MLVYTVFSSFSQIKIIFKTLVYTYNRYSSDTCIDLCILCCVFRLDIIHSEYQCLKHNHLFKHGGHLLNGTNLNGQRYFLVLYVFMQVCARFDACIQKCTISSKFDVNPPY